MLRISWTAKKSNETDLRKTDTKPHINKMRKRQAFCLGHVMRKEKLEYIVATGMIETLQWKTA